jgi:hypothetical protein
MVALWCVAAFSLSAAEPPPDLLKKAAQQELRSLEARSNYTYKQTVVIEEFNDRGSRVGDYREVREVIFSPQGERTERFVGKPLLNLKRLQLTEEDFRDLREVQGVLFTPDLVWNYESKFKGEETVDGVACWLLFVRPRQILQGQRMFEGLFWIDQRDFSIVRSEGQAVPQKFSNRPGKENLFPHFTTIREKVGEFWFPIHTYADDTLQFATGPQRLKMIIRYANYQRFGAESKILSQ